MSFGVYADPYNTPFVDGGTYMPAAFSIYTFVLPQFSEPYIILAIYEGTPGNAVLLNSQLLFNSSPTPGTAGLYAPNNYLTLQPGGYYSGASPIMGQPFFAVEYGASSAEEITTDDTYLRTGVGTAPEDLNIVHWKWGPAAGPSIFIGAINGDDVINSSAAPHALTIAGTSAGVTGETVTVGLNGAHYTSTIGNDGSWSVTVPQSAVSELRGTLTVTADVTDQFGTLAPEATRNLTAGETLTYLNLGDTGQSSATYQLAGHAYVADNGGGLQILDISSPNSPQLIGTYANSPSVNYDAVVVVGALAYVADLNAGLEIIDVSNPSSPSLVGSYSITGTCNSVAVEGDYAFINDFNNHAIRIVDVSNPSAPALVGSVATPSQVGPGSPSAMLVSGTYLYIADFAPAIYIENISNPSNPTLVGTYATLPTSIPSPLPAGTTNSPDALFLSGNDLYVADENTGLYILNVANPAAPTLVGSYDPGLTDNHFTDVTVVGTTAYVTDNTGRFIELDVSNPAAPTLIASYVVGSDAQGVSVSGDHAYIATSATTPLESNSNFLVIADISDTLSHPDQPPIISSVSSLPSSGELGPRGIVTLTVNFDKVVTVAGGTPTLSLNDGGVATYQSGSGTTALVFTYTIGAFGSGQNTPDLALAATNAFQLNGATIADASGTAADLSAANGYNPDGILKVDTTDPIVTGVTAAAHDGSHNVDAGTKVAITISLDEAVTLRGRVPSLSLNDGATATYDAAVSKPSTGKLVFDYMVGAKQNTDDLQVSSVNVPNTTGTSIKDAGGHSADFSNVSAFTTGLEIDTTPPTVISITSTPNSGTLGLHNTATITVTMSGGVAVTGSPTLQLNDGGVATFDATATAAMQDPTKLVFDYTVGNGQHTTDLTVEKIMLPAHSSIDDLAGNVANVTAANGYPLDVVVQVPSGYLLGLDTNIDINTAAEAQAIKAAGYQFVVQYLRATETKLPTVDSNAGLTIVSVYENQNMADSNGLTGWKQHFSTVIDTARNAPLPSESLAENNGYADGAAAFAYAAKLGQPYGTAIYFAIDLDPAGHTKAISEANLLLGIQDYFKGVNEYFAGRNGGTYDVGVYGAAATVAAVMTSDGARYTWVSQSWPDPNGLHKESDLWQPDVAADAADKPISVNNSFNFPGIGTVDVDYADPSGFGGWLPSKSATTSSTGLSMQPVGSTTGSQTGFAIANGQNSNANQVVLASPGGSGADNFVFRPGVGADTILNFNPHVDTIELDNFSNIQSIQQLASFISNDGHGDAVIGLGHGDSITLPGTTSEQLHQLLTSVIHLH